MTNRIAQALAICHDLLTPEQREELRSDSERLDKIRQRGRTGLDRLTARQARKTLDTPAIDTGRRKVH